MKKYSKKINLIKKTAVLPGLIMVLSGCTSDFDAINTDPNAITADKLDESFVGPAFANALYKGTHNGSSVAGIHDDHGTYGLITMLHSMLFVHYQSSTDNNWVTDRNGINDGWRARGWLRFYTQAVTSLNNAYIAGKGNKELVAILDIWKVYMYHKVTDHWGSVPYTKAGIGGASVPYDTQEFMYNDFFKLLTKANATLSAASKNTIEPFVGFDRVFDGNVDKWRRFGNSLRLRLALRIADVNKAKAKTEAEAAVAAGVMESNDYSAYYKTSANTNNNLLLITGRGGWGFHMTASMESILEGYKDPRLKVWFSPAKNSGDAFVGKPNGAPMSDKLTRDDVAATNDDTFGSALQATKPIEIMMAAESYFNRAEGALNAWNMGDNARKLYETGIALSMNQWGITDRSAIKAYVEGVTLPVAPDLVSIYTEAGFSAAPPVKVPVAWAAGEAEQRIQITVQKYLALFPEPMEAWADLRRTDADILYPVLNSLDTEVGSKLMKRITYLPNEYSTNADAVKAAIQTLGGPDNQATRLWWDVK